MSIQWTMQGLVPSGFELILLDAPFGNKKYVVHMIHFIIPAGLPKPLKQYVNPIFLTLMSVYPNKTHSLCYLATKMEEQRSYGVLIKWQVI